MNKQEIIENTILKIKQKLNNADQKIINLSQVIQKIPTNINELYEQLRVITDQEYPTLDKYLTIKEYVSFYLLENKDKENLQKIGLSEKNILQIIKIINSNIGINLNKDIKSITNNLAKNILDLITTKEKIQKEIDTLLKENYSNTYQIATPDILSKMLEIAGSFKRLSRFPSSTIQLLGSEKNFFKALKFNKKTPKYGIIYNHPLVISLPPKNKGKFSRSLASKISIALKADINNIDIYDELNEKIKKRVNNLK